MNLDQLTPLFIGLNVKRFDILKLLFQNLLKESDQDKPKSHWILDHQQQFTIEETKHSIHYKLRPRTRSMRPLDQEINNHYQWTTRKPKIFNIFAPNNNNRFDNWGG